jgi:hypothetical protein
MANPYYIAPRSTVGEDMARLGSLGLQLYGLKQHGELARSQQALTAQELGMKGEQLAEQKRVSEIQWGTPERIEAPAMEGGEPRLTPGTEGLEQRKMKVLEQTAEEEKKKNADIENFEPLKAGRVVQKLKSLGLSEEYPLVKKIKELGWNAKITNYDAYQEIKSLYPQFRQEMGEKVIADFEKKSEANPLYAKSPEGQAQQQFVMALARDDTGDSILGAAFVDTIAARWRRQGPAMTAQAHLATALRGPGAQSDIGKLQADKERLLQSYGPDSPIIKAIDLEIENKSRGTQGKIPSSGNAVDLAISEKFGDPAFLTDPVKNAEALKWLGTDEGKKAVGAAALRLSPATNIFIGTTTAGDIVTMPGKGSPTPAVTPAPPGGLGPKQLSEDLKKDQTAVAQARDLIKSLKDQWGDLGITGRASAIKTYTEGKTGYNPNAKVYADVRDGFLGNLSRSIAAERGVLTQIDIDRIAKTLPKIGLDPTSVDSAVEAEKKWKVIEGILDSAEKRMGERYRMTPTNPTGTTPGRKIGRFTVEAE